MTLVSALNLVWAAIGVTAFAGLAYHEARRRSPLSSMLRRAAAVFLVTVTLFPCVSASDDLFSFAFLQEHLGKHGGIGTPLPEDGKEKSSQLLARALSALEHIHTTGVYAFAVVFSFIAVVVLAQRAPVYRTLFCRAGRAPPSL